MNKSIEALIEECREKDVIKLSRVDEIIADDEDVDIKDAIVGKTLQQIDDELAIPTRDLLMEFDPNYSGMMD